MGYSLNLISAGAFATATLTLILAIVGVSRWKVRAAPCFSALMLCLTLYSFGSGFEFMSPTVAVALGWNHVAYIGIALLPLTLLLFVLDFTKSPRAQSLPLIALLIVLSLIALVSQETTGLDHLFFDNPHQRLLGPIRSLIYRAGPFYLPIQLYLGGAILVAFLLIAREARRSTGVRRMQCVTIDGGLLIGAGGYLMYLINLSPDGVDLSPLFLALTGLLLGFGLFRYRILNFAPVAHLRVFGAMREGGIILDHENCLIDFNSAARRIFPQLSADRLGERMEAVLAGDAALRELALANHEHKVELHLPVEGTIRSYDADLSLVKSRQQRVREKVIVLNDTTRHHERVRTLQELAIRDSLTHLLTRGHFAELVAAEMERARRGHRPAAMIMIDLDDFKGINDNFGHPAGDAVLVETAASFRQALRISDILCRYGGDEFLVFLPETDLPGATRVAERMRTMLLERTARMDHGDRRITGSFGVAAFPSVTTESLDDLLRAADEALYRAKLAGRDQVSGAQTTE